MDKKKRGPGVQFEAVKEELLVRGMNFVECHSNSA